MRGLLVRPFCTLPLCHFSTFLLLLAAALAFVHGAAAQTPQKPPKAPAQHPAKRPDRLRALWAQAEEAIEKRDYARAVEALQQYLAERPGDAVAHFQLGYAFTGLDRREEARAEYRKAAELDPMMAEAHLNLGLVLLEREPAAAVEPLQRAAELRPQKAQPRYLAGLALERAGKLEAAVEQYRLAAQLEEKNFDIRFALGRALHSLGRAADAEAEFRAALALRPDSAPARLGLAESLVAQKKLDESAAQLAAYLEREPQDQESRLQLASIYLDLGKSDDALAELARAEAGGNRSAKLFELRGDAHLQGKRLAEAAEAFAKALEAEPRNASLHARLGRVELERRNFPAAEKALLEALRQNASLTYALRDLAATYYLGERYEAALHALDALGQRETLPTGSWFIRATCYDKLGRKAEALEAYEKFVTLDQGRNDTQDFQARQRIRILKRELKKK